MGKLLKIVFVFFLISSWLLTGWPGIWRTPHVQFPPEVGRVNALTQVANWAFTGNATGWSSTNGTATNTCGTTTSGAATNMSTFAYSSNKWGAVSGATASTSYKGMILQTFVAPGSGTVKVKGRVDYSVTIATGGSGTWGSAWVRLDIYNNTNGTYVGNLSCTAVTANRALASTNFDSEVSLTGGTTYTARVSIAVTNGTKARAKTFVVDNVIVDAAPVGFTAAVVNGTTNAQLNWTTSTGGTGSPAISTYKVYRDIASPVTMSDYLADSATNSYIDTSSAGYTTYYYAITTVDANNIESPLSAEASVLTLPTAPANVAATRTLTDKITITWTKSTGANQYHVWRNTTDLGVAGDVAIFDDTGAGAPTITAGSTVASDGTSTSQVNLSLSGTSANNGASYTYKVVASNASGNGPDSATDTGYRAPGTLSYQWQRSSVDSDGSYSDIGGATNPTYGDTGAPADGSGRYYKCVLSATGAAGQTSLADRGYRAYISISITTDGSVPFGTVVLGGIKHSGPSGMNHPETVSIDGGPATLRIKSSNFSEGGNTWALADSNGANQVKWEFSKDASSWTTFSSPDPADYLFEAGVAQGQTRNIYLRITMPTSTASYNQYSSSVTIVASAP
jgi:fibronectin type 3 domain-containing protein